MHDGFLSFMHSGDFRLTDELRIKVKETIRLSLAGLTIYNSTQHISTHT